MPLSVPRDGPSEPILAWRAWTCTPAGMLRSLTYPLAWAGQSTTATDPLAMRAVCMRGHTNHRAPHRACGCGWYGLKTAAQVLPWIHVRQRMSALPRVRRIVIGRVALWGLVVEHAEGYRAEFAYPACLYVPSRALVRPLSERYRVEVYPLYLLRPALTAAG